MAQQRRWQIDWAGKHGTALGTINGILITITASWLGHVAALLRHFPSGAMVAVTALGTVLTVAYVFARAAFRQTHPVTVLYKVTCVIGAGCWVGWTLTEQRWALWWWIYRLAMLILLAIIAGATAAAVKDRPEKPAEEQDTQPTKIGKDLDARATEWTERIRRVCNIRVDEINGIQDWTRTTPDGTPVGYTVEATCPKGGSSYTTIRSYEQALANDLDLPIGGKVEVDMGVSRRVALIKVTTINMLAEEQPYPLDLGTLDINQPLPAGVVDNGDHVGPAIRSQCFGIFGQSGSGKTNALHTTAAGIVQCDNALLWDLEFTGGGLTRPWTKTFLAGETKQPAVDWPAVDEREGLFMLRALTRINYRRKEVYQDLMDEADDDKIPASRDVPGIILRHDEIAKTLGTPSFYPQHAQLIKFLVFEARASIIRLVLGGLEATNGVIDPDTKRQIGAIACMRSQDEEAYSWAFGNWSHGLTTEMIPYPGCGGISLDTGLRPVGMKWFRITPSAIREISIMTDGRHPALDEPSRLAADGRNPDGTPMDDMLPGELDCYSTRWDRFRKAAGRLSAKQAKPSGGVAVAGKTATITDAITGLEDCERRLREAIVNGEPERDWEAEFNAIVSAQTRPNTELPRVGADSEPQEKPPARAVNPRDLAISLVAEDGTSVDEIKTALREAGINVSRSTIYEWLKDSAEVEHRPDRPGSKRGRFYRRTS